MAVYLVICSGMYEARIDAEWGRTGEIFFDVLPTATLLLQGYNDFLEFL